MSMPDSLFVVTSHAFMQAQVSASVLSLFSKLHGNNAVPGAFRSVFPLDPRAALLSCGVGRH